MQKQRLKELILILIICCYFFTVGPNNWAWKYMCNIHAIYWYQLCEPLVILRVRDFLKLFVTFSSPRRQCQQFAVNIQFTNDVNYARVWQKTLFFIRPCIKLCFLPRLVYPIWCKILFFQSQFLTEKENKRK